MNTIILFDNKNNIGNIPYKNYNCSILKLNSNEVSELTNNNYNNNAILITFFVSSPNKYYGSMTWIGIICYDMLF